MHDARLLTGTAQPPHLRAESWPRLASLRGRGADDPNRNQAAKELAHLAHKASYDKQGPDRTAWHRDATRSITFV